MDGVKLTIETTKDVLSVTPDALVTGKISETKVAEPTADPASILHPAYFCPRLRVSVVSFIFFS